MAKRDEIINAAMNLFFTRGYDAVSVRMIQRAVNNEAGLFYYYFKSKDDVLDKVLDKYFSNYTGEVEKIIRDGKRDPFQLMNKFFRYVKSATDEFRQKYEQNMHRSMRWAIRERTLTILEPYVEQILKILSEYDISPRIDSKAAAMFLTHGVGSFILHEDGNFVKEKKRDIAESINLIMGFEAREAALLSNFQAEQRDKDELKFLIKECTGLLPNELEKIFSGLDGRIAREEIFVTRHENKLVGAIIFSKAESKIEAVSVLREYRWEGVAKRLFMTACAQFPVGSEIFLEFIPRESEKNLELFFQKMGFEGSEINCDCKKMVLKIPPDKPPMCK